MKISLNSIRDINQRYSCTDQDITAGDASEIVEKIGAQLGAVEETIRFGDKFEGVIIGKVISCQKHPDADRLSVCFIDDGGKAEQVERNKDGLVQVVCGAPNVREGLIVAWLPPGSTVPDTVGKEPFVLEARELRGVVSNGMLASPKELALGDSHEGILEIDTDIAPGTDFAEAFGLKGDRIIDIENKMFTHRPDCFGFLGVARELSGIQGISYKSPDWYISSPTISKPEGETLPLVIRNELPKLVPRLTAVVMSNVGIGPSPTWLQIELAKYGSRSINNIVDYTNYFMLLTGQPLHAYDYDKVKAFSDGDATITIRHPHKAEKLTLLNSKQVEPRAEAILIATDKQAIGIGGVMGGADTEVDATTKNIILECATFDMYSVRRTSMAHGLFTDAVTRFNKGQSSLQNMAVLSRIVGEIVNHAGGTVASQIIDDNHVDPEVLKRNAMHPSVEVTADFINNRLGLELSAEQMKKLLTNVEFVVSVADITLTVRAPFWRTDIELREDVVEEVGRLYGFDKLPLSLPIRSITPTVKDDFITFKTVLRKSLVSFGANEVLSYSFVPAKLLEAAGQDPEQAFKISNALSPELQYYRLSLMPSLLEKIHPNIKAGYDQFALFELGKGHNLMHADDDNGLPTEFEMLDLVVTASDKCKPQGAPFYQAKLYLDTLAAACGLQLVYEPLAAPSKFPLAQPYEYTRSALVRDTTTGGAFGIVGEFTPEVRRAFKLPAFSAGFNVSPRHLMNAAKKAPNSYRSLPRFPKVSQDLTLKVASTLAFQELHSFLVEKVSELQQEQSTSELLGISIFQKQDATEYKQITFRLNIANHARTLTDKEVNELLEQVTAAAGKQFGAERV